MELERVQSQHSHPVSKCRVKVAHGLEHEGCVSQPDRKDVGIEVIIIHAEVHLSAQCDRLAEVLCGVIVRGRHEDHVAWIGNAPEGRALWMLLKVLAHLATPLAWRPEEQLCVHALRQRIPVIVSRKQMPQLAPIKMGQPGLGVAMERKPCAVRPHGKHAVCVVSGAFGDHDAVNVRRDTLAACCCLERCGKNVGVVLTTHEKLGCLGHVLPH
eukprot:5306188-Prymnesium_polylepis.2